MNGRKHSARWLFGPAADIDDLTFDQKVNQMGDVRPMPADLRPRVVPLIPMNLRRAPASSRDTAPGCIREPVKNNAA